MKQRQIVESQTKSKTRSRPTPAPLPNQSVALKVSGPHSLPEQSARLGEPGWQAVQRQQMVARIGQVQGNQHLQRVVQLSREQNNSTLPFIQRDEDETAQPVPQSLKMREVTVPVPEEQRQRVAPPAGTEATEPQTEPPPVPQQARIRIPIDLDFNLLPPELKIQLLEEFNFTATVTAAQFAWQQDRLQLGLNYDYGGAITGTARYKADFGALSGSASYDPTNNTGTFGAGFRRGAWQAGATANTAGAVGGQLSFGAALPPLAGPFSESIMAGEQSGRHLLGSVPSLLDDPARAPELLNAHEGDIENVSKAAKNIGQLIDLQNKDTGGINWGFYLRFARTPDSAVSVMGGVGITLKRDETK